MGRSDRVYNPTRVKIWEDPKPDDPLTTGEIAKICRVAPRTVSKWVDSGKLRGYRIPGSQDRRVTRSDLWQFIQTNDMHPTMLDRAGYRQVRVLAVGCEDVPNWERTGPFELLARLATINVRAVVVDTQIGRGPTLDLVAAVREKHPDLPIHAVYGDDDVTPVQSDFITSHLLRPLMPDTIHDIENPKLPAPTKPSTRASGASFKKVENL